MTKEHEDILHAGKRLEEVLSAVGLTQIELAKLTNKSQPSISAYINRSDFSMKIIGVLEGPLKERGINMGFFRGVDQPMFQKNVKPKFVSYEKLAEVQGEEIEHLREKNALLERIQELQSSIIKLREENANLIKQLKET